jgi:HAD superfamily hydrolase (TIGR01548 family)
MRRYPLSKNSQGALVTRVDVLIFDMDGVLVDVSLSYREAIRRVPQIFLEKVCGLEPLEGDMVCAEVVEAFKLAGGLNNDWDCTAAVAAAFASSFEKPLPLPREGGGMATYLEALADWGSRLDMTVEEVANGADPLGVAERVARGGGGLAVALRASGLTEDLFPVAFGSPLKSNVIMRLFQEMYLGPELFERIYTEPPLVLYEQGLIEHERLLIDRAVLKDLASRLPLGIATGRPRAEAAHALDQHGIADLFTGVVDDDDVRQAETEESSKKGVSASLSKPNPWSLIEAVRRISLKVSLAAYVGDTPDDIRAAKTAAVKVPFLAIGTSQRPRDFKKALATFREVGADIVLGHPNGLRFLDIWPSSRGERGAMRGKSR